MALIDINKNSLPEQVQENKEKIADLESTIATKTYVDDQDAATLGLAKAYADGKDATTLQTAKDYADGKDATTLQTAKDYADLAAAGALGDAKTYADSGLALKQNALTDSSVPDGTLDKAIGFDSNGDLVKGTAGGGGGLTLVWSGAVQLTPGSDTSVITTLTNNKNYLLIFQLGTLEYWSHAFICPINDLGGANILCGYQGGSYIVSWRYSVTTRKISCFTKENITGTNTNNPKLTAIYEVN